MKIVQIITRGNLLAGAQTHVIELSIALKERGHEVFVLCGNPQKIQERLKSEKEITFIPLKKLGRSINPFSDIAAYLELRNLLQQIQPDVVAAHSSKAGLLSRLVCHKLNIPNTFTVHGWSFTDGIPMVKKAIFLRVEKLAGKFSKMLFTTAMADRELGLKYNIVPADKIVNIYNGVLDRKSQKRPVTERKTVKICMAARFNPQKDHFTLIEALQQLQHLDWELNLLGGGSLMEEVKLQVKQCNLESRINFHGEVENVYDHLNDSDCFALITNWEGFPFSILEAMVHSLPIIATDVAGVRESVRNNQNGFLVKRGDVEATKSALEKIITDVELRQNFGKNSRKLYEENFTMEVMVDNILMNYQKLVDKSSPNKLVIEVTLVNS